MTVRQYRLARATSLGTETLTTWLEHPALNVGQTIRLRDDGDWIVTRIGQTASCLPNHVKARKQHRKRTGDAEPRKRPASADV